MMSFFGATHEWGAKKVPPPQNLSHISYNDETNTVIPYLKKIQKIYVSRDTPLQFFKSEFFHWKSANFAISRNTGIDCNLINNFLFF